MSFKNILGHESTIKKLKALIALGRVPPALLFSGGKELEELETGEARVGRLRGYGDAIVAPVAAEFIKAYCEARGL